MPYSYLVALTRFVEGREAEFNDWYSWVHLRDVMRLGYGVVAAQRFRRDDALAGMGRSAYDQPYLCLYEVTDPAAMTRAHAPVFTDEMPISDAYTAEDNSEVYFDEIAGFNSRPGEHGAPAVIIERIDAGACPPSVRDWYVRERFTAIGRLPGVVAGSLGQPNPHQMFQQELSALCAIYWTRELAATAVAFPLLPRGVAGLDPATVSLDGYAAVIERLTMIDVREASAEDRAKALAVRAGLGDRVLTGPPASIVTDMFG